MNSWNPFPESGYHWWERQAGMTSLSCSRPSNNWTQSESSLVSGLNVSVSTRSQSVLCYLTSVKELAQLAKGLKTQGCTLTTLIDISTRKERPDSKQWAYIRWCTPSGHKRLDLDFQTSISPWHFLSVVATLSSLTAVSLKYYPPGTNRAWSI